MINHIVNMFFEDGRDVTEIHQHAFIRHTLNIDNIAFTLGLGERVRARVEDAARVELNDLEAATLAWTKTLHTAMVVVAAVLGVFLAEFEPVFALSFGSFFLGGVAQSCALGATVGQKCKRGCCVVVSSLLGVVTFGFAFAFVYMN